MALTKCPECGKEVSTNAETCPHCGNPLKIKSNESTFKVNKEPVDNIWINKYKHKRRNSIMVSIVYGLIFVGACIGCFIAMPKVDSFGAMWALFAIGFIFLIIGLFGLLSCLTSFKINTRLIDGYTVLAYSGFKTIVAVDDVVKCTGAFKRSLYVVLPNDHHVIVNISAWDGSISISINN